MGRRVGDMGHNDFAKLCSSVGLICNNSQNNDSAGWDSFVEFPLPSHTSLTMQQPTQPIQCMVQIKSTDKNKKSVSVKLSNLKRFCESHLPCFFFFAEYGNDINPVAIYLVHIDREWIFKILKKVRECEVSQASNLHKKMMSVTYSDKDKISEYSGAALKRKIESYVQDGMGAYASKKLELLKTLGYENGILDLSFDLASKDDLKAIVKASLGYDNEVNITNIRGWDKRFGIKIKVDNLSLENATIKLTEVAANFCGNVFFEKDSFELMFPCQCFMSPLALSAPEDLSEFRVKADNFDLNVGIKKPIAEIIFSSEDKVVNLLELSDLLMLKKYLYCDASSLKVRLVNGEGREFCYKITGNDKVDKKEIIKLKLLHDTMKDFVLLANKYHFVKHCQLSFRDFYENLNNIKTMVSMLKNNGSRPALRIKFPDVQFKFDHTKKVHTFIAIPLNFTSMIVCLLFTASGFGYFNDDEYLFSSYEIKINKMMHGRDITQLHNQIITVVQDFRKRSENEDAYFYDSVSSSLLEC
ncbi:hypothetical protein [Vagococcus sp. WN89Y]|uniref:hypothetical protein n=1 Tax=Vagococcus sp. WN89Y TaxID=3457258 RepID=UPI003FCDC22A